MRKRKVLVVEDQKLNRAVLKEILESEYDVLPHHSHQDQIQT